MISAIPPPRPVSVNALARASSVSNPITSCSKSNRSTSAEIQTHEGSFAVPVGPDSPGWPQSPVDTEMEDVHTAETETQLQSESRIQFEHLPVEIHETILDYLFGERTSPFVSLGGKAPSRGWNKSLRHPRRKALTNLALILPVWRVLVQDRIYRHVKIKGTMDELAACAGWFRAHPHLAPYVRHVEIWIPVWGQRAVKSFPRPLLGRPLEENIGYTSAVAALEATMAWEESQNNPMADYKYHYASCNATLEEMFLHVHNVFPGARILTLEGGHCKKPPMVRHFRTDPNGRSGRQRLPVLLEIQTFVMRGAWNIMRNHQHWNNLSEALPGVREWHCQYAKPKIEGYETIAGILRRLPPSLLHINVSLEGFYSKDNSHTRWMQDGINPPHLCRLLGEVAPRLESLSFTGKVCACLFDPSKSSKPQTNLNKSKLKSLDLVVKTCCRDKKLHPGLPFLDDYSGITNLNFIRAFEKLVVAAITGLKTHQEMNYMRIRFIDLDSACPPLNPYFHLDGNRCTGLWNDTILKLLREVRPEAGFAQLLEGISTQYGHNNQIIGAIYPRTRPLSIHASTYRIIADAPKH